MIRYIRTKWILLAGFLAIAALLTSCGAYSTAPTAASGTSAASQTVEKTPSDNAADHAEQVINVTASNWEWTLDHTTVKAGQTVRFHITGDTGAHGFSIVGTEISDLVSSGETKDIVWTPKEAGTFTIKCNHFCGSGHSKMEAVLTVQ